MVSVKQGVIKYHFLSLWYEIETRFPGPFANTLLVWPIAPLFRYYCFLSCNAPIQLMFLKDIHYLLTSNWTSNTHLRFLLQYSLAEFLLSWSVPVSSCAAGFVGDTTWSIRNTSSPFKIEIISANLLLEISNNLDIDNWLIFLARFAIFIFISLEIFAIYVWLFTIFKKKSVHLWKKIHTSGGYFSV